MLSSYSKFISNLNEDMILESIESYQFILSDELSDIFYKMSDDNKEYSEIARLYLALDLSGGHESLSISYLTKGSDNVSIGFLDPRKINKIKTENEWTVRDVFNNVKTKNSIRIGKLTNKIIELYNKKFGDKLSFSNQEIEKFVNVYKSYYDYNKADNFKVVDGSLINYWYAEDNYQLPEVGTLGNSCMKSEDANSYLDMYNSNKNVKLLILLGIDNKLLGRAILWDLIDGKFMDRVYTTDESDVELFIKWAENNEYSYKFLQNSKLGQICSPKNDYKPDTIKMEVKVYSISYSSRYYENFPYMDTMKYYYWEEGILRNYRKKDNELSPGESKFFVFLEDTYGWCECPKCLSDGQIICDSCEGTGKVSCDMSQCYSHTDECDNCESGYVECVDCDGDGQITCDSCGGFSLN